MKELTLKFITTFTVVTLLILWLQACQDSEPERVRIKVPNPVQLNYKFMATPEEVNEAYYAILDVSSTDSIDEEELGGHRGDVDKRAGFHYYQGDKCYLVLLIPSQQTYKEFEKTVGHEMIHCLFGKFHATNGKLPSKLSIIGEPL